MQIRKNNSLTSAATNFSNTTPQPYYFTPKLAFLIQEKRPTHFLSSKFSLFPNTPTQNSKKQTNLNTKSNQIKSIQ